MDAILSKAAKLLICILVVGLVNRLSVKFSSAYRCALEATPRSSTFFVGIAISLICAKYFQLFTTKVNASKQLTYTLWLAISFVIFDMGFFIYQWIEYALQCAIPSGLQLVHWNDWSHACKSRYGKAFTSNMLSLASLAALYRYHFNWDTLSRELADKDGGPEGQPQEPQERHEPREHKEHQRHPDHNRHEHEKRQWKDERHHKSGHRGTLCMWHKEQLKLSSGSDTGT